MTEMPSRLSRRRLLQLGGSLTAGALGAGALASLTRLPGTARAGASAVHPSAAIDRYVALAGTDGWIALPVPQSNPFSKWLPDSMAPDPQNAYVYGFRDVSTQEAQIQAALANPRNAVLTARAAAAKQAIYALKGKTQNPSPLLVFDEGERIMLTLYNLGWQQRPDIPDGHTIHWHGFRNAIPWFDGVPEMSAGAPIYKNLYYYYQPEDAGTYMYHCHWEDVEHVQMGMTGVIFVRPKQNRSPLTSLPGYRAGEKYVYNDGDGTTAYDREFAFMLMDYDLQQHWKLSHIQQPDWSDYNANAWLLNGRSYPDTLSPNGFLDAVNDNAAAGALQFQPISSRITCMTGDRVLLRLANLGYQNHVMTLPGLAMKVVGRDAALLRSRDGTDTTYSTETLEIAPGESYDAIFTAPAFSGGSGTSGKGYDSYMFYDRNYANDPSGGDAGFGGMATEVHVFETSKGLAAQRQPNDWGM